MLQPANLGLLARLPVVAVPKLDRVPAERRILDAGEEAFLSTPLHQVKVAAIAAAADVSVGTIYLHFGSKAGLHASVREDVHLELLEYALVPVTQDRTHWADVVEYSHRWERIFRGDVRRARLIASLESTECEEQHAVATNRRIDERHASAVLQGASRIARLTDQGDIRPCDPHTTSAWIDATILGTAMGLLQHPVATITPDLVAGAFEAQRKMLAQCLLPVDRLEDDGTAPREYWATPKRFRRS